MNHDVKGIYAGNTFDHPLRPCGFSKWLKYDSLPIEQACFVLLGFEPAPIAVIRARQIQYQERRLPTWEKPHGFDDVLGVLASSIENANLQALSITVDQYLTKQVHWPALLTWARAKGYVIPLELESKVVVGAPEPAPPPESHAPPEPNAPPPLTTGDIAHSFDGLHQWDEAKWKTNLANKPKWLSSCVAIAGQQGVAETRWNPVLIGAALATKGVAPRSIRARFQRNNLLSDWLEAWKDYESQYLTTD
jgi:hypothetical protein